MLLQSPVQHLLVIPGLRCAEGLAGKVLGRLDVGAGRQRAPTGDRLLRQVEHELQVSALRVERGDVAQRGEAHVGHAVLDAGFSSGLGGRQDLHVDVGILVIAELLSHVQTDVVRVRRPVEHERHGRRGAGVLGIGVADKERTSTSFFIVLIFSLCVTPKRCSSSITSSPRFLYCMSLDNKRCVPITTSTVPFLSPSIVSFCSFAVQNLDIMRTVIG